MTEPATAMRIETMHYQLRSNRVESIEFGRLTQH